MSAPSLFSNPRINLLVIINVTVLTYLIVLAGGFSSLDDMGMMRDLQQGHFSFRSLLTSGGGRYYRPLVMLSFYGNYTFSGTNPAVFHATNLLLHVLNACLLYAICNVYLRDRQWGMFGALIAALLFAVTPLNCEAVSWISARTDLLCCLFFLIAVRVVLAENMPALPASVLFGLAFLCSLFAKESSAPLLVIVPLYLLNRKSDGSGRGRLFLFSAAALLAGLLYALLRTGGSVHADQGVSKVVAQVSGHSLLQIVYDSLAATGFYLKKLLWPFPLNLAINTIDRALYAPIGLLALLLLTVLFVRLKDARLPILIMVGCLGPPLLALHGSIPWTLYAERYLYLSTAGAAMLAGLAAAYLRSRLPAAVPFALVLVLALSANSRAALWADPLELWSNTVVRSQQFPAARVVYAYELIQVDRLDEAQRYLDIVPSRDVETEFFWKCRAMIHLKRQDSSDYEQAMLKAAALSSSPAETRTEMEKNLRRIKTQNNHD